MKIQLKRGLSLAVSTAMLLMGIVIMAATPAQAAVSGTILCSAGTDVPGVWIESAVPSQSGWATTSVIGGDPKHVTFSRSQVGSSTNYKVHTACKGPSWDWSMNVSSRDWGSGTRNLICHPSSSPTRNFCYDS